MQIAWLLTFILIIVSLVFVWLYGIQFGESNASKWLTSFMISIVLNVVLVYPLTVGIV